MNCIKRFLEKREIKKLGTSKCVVNKLAFIIGHSFKKRGAYSYPLQSYEYSFWSNFVKWFEVIDLQGVEVKSFYRDGVGINGAYKNAVEWGASAIIELHFNSFNGNVQGCEVLYNNKKDKADVREKAFAAQLLYRVNEVLGNNYRGSKLRTSKGERGFMNVSQTMKIPSVIIEPFFGDHDWDANNARNKSEALAESMVAAFKEFASLA